MVRRQGQDAFLDAIRAYGTPTAANIVRFLLDGGPADLGEIVPYLKVQEYYRHMDSSQIRSRIRSAIVELKKKEVICEYPQDIALTETGEESAEKIFSRYSKPRTNN